MLNKYIKSLLFVFFLKKRSLIIIYFHFHSLIGKSSHTISGLFNLAAFFVVFRRALLGILFGKDHYFGLFALFVFAIGSRRRFARVTRAALHLIRIQYRVDILRNIFFLQIVNFKFLKKAKLKERELTVENVFERLLHIVRVERGHFDERQVVLFGKRFGLLFGHRSQMLQIGLVADEHYDHFVVAMLFELAEPLFHIAVRFVFGDVVD